MRSLMNLARGVDSSPQSIGRRPYLTPAQMREVNRNYGETVIASTVLIRETILSEEFRKAQFIPLGLETAIKTALRIVDKYFPDAPKEVDVQMNGSLTIPAPVWNALTLDCESSVLPLPTRSDGANGYSIRSSTNGKSKPQETSRSQVASRESAATAQEKHSSSQDSVAGSWLASRPQE